MGSSARWNTLRFPQAEEAMNAERRIQNGQADERPGLTRKLTTVLPSARSRQVRPLRGNYWDNSGTKSAS